MYDGVAILSDMPHYFPVRLSSEPLQQDREALGQLTSFVQVWEISFYTV
jgi:hypothetical protein